MKKVKKFFPKENLRKVEINSAALYGYLRLKMEPPGAIIPVFKDISSTEITDLYYHGVNKNGKIEHFFLDQDLKVEHIFLLDENRFDRVCVGDYALVGFEFPDGHVYFGSKEDLLKKISGMNVVEAFSSYPFSGLEIARLEKSQENEIIFAEYCVETLVRKFSGDFAGLWLDGAEVSDEAKAAGKRKISEVVKSLGANDPSETDKAKGNRVRVDIKLWGGGGASGGNKAEVRDGKPGGGAGYVETKWDLPAGSELRVLVGEGGKPPLENKFGGGGGGRSEVRVGKDLLVIAGGGGGGSRGPNNFGGAGGGEEGQAGGGGAAGGGGTQVAGGKGGAPGGVDGSNLLGGDGGGTNVSGSAFGGGASGTGDDLNFTAGGGGGGWFGGGGGGTHSDPMFGGGGGGGSSYVNKGYLGYLSSELVSGNMSEPGGATVHLRDDAGMGGVKGEAGRPGKALIRINNGSLVTINFTGNEQLFVLPAGEKNN